MHNVKFKVNKAFSPTGTTVVEAKAGEIHPVPTVVYDAFKSAGYVEDTKAEKAKTGDKSK